MFIADAYAQATTGGLQGMTGGLMQLLPFAAILGVLYMMLFRPQQKKMKDHRAMVAALKRGDRVVTSGGILGVVTKVVDGAELQVEVAEGVRIRVLRNSITEVLTRGDSAKVQDNKAPATPADKKSGGR